ncbi:glycosyltransferase [Constantimarinum furrinae]|uniref:Glycosyl transferase family 1 protein n=1 Tax=Constantimarinum furrinae TaxID=2562285 RepID=A0A7G8PT09_9FLAO|nr:glycosyltransferase [Constantimarinum furrinae]QNJ97475.1 Glycosyl transferase family 1 protein [Constantimarinum furrinae]
MTKKVLVVDWLDKYGGAERVISSLCTVFDFSKCYLLINIMNKNNLNKVFANKLIPVEETVIRHFGSKFRYMFFTFSGVVRRIKIEKDVDVIISSSHAIAKGVKKSGAHQVHISYFQARNLKYIWDDYKLYFGWLRYIMFPLVVIMRRMDVRDAQTPDFIISNSHFVKEWVKRTYNRDSEVIYPPVDLTNFSLVTEKEDYYVAVGRIEPYKRFDIVIDAFNTTNKKLIVVGDGSQLKELKDKANSNISFVGFVSSEEVFKYISKAKGFIHAGIEDFGIAPIEAQACGTPVIAYGFGGVLETIVENSTGVFFKEENKESLMAALHNFEAINFDYNAIRENAERFSQHKFESEIDSFVEDKIKNND